MHDARLQACGLPAAWRGAPAWRILDCGFGTGAAFAATAAAWRADAAAPRMLHYVGIVPQPPMVEQLCAAVAAQPALADQAAVLRAQCFGLLPGFHRLVLCEGRLRLTLCIGPVPALLREQQFVADSLYLEDGAAFCAERLAARALARLCRPGSRLALRLAAGAAAPMDVLRPLGFQSTAADRAAPWRTLEYAPAWPLPAAREGWRESAQAPSDCVVLGAGLAGAAVAAALAVRGWQVTVLDAGEAPAAGASGLPAGVMAMPTTRDDAPRSRLARAGIRLALHACRTQLREGADWQPCGALELATDGEGAAGALLPAAWPAEGADWSRTLDDGRVPAAVRALAAASTDATGATGLWHAHAAWVRPAALVQALLSWPGIRFAGGCTVAQARHDGARWQLEDAAGRPLASARQLVLCMARESTGLLERIAAAAPGAAGIVRLSPMQGVGGTVSGGPHEDGDGMAFPRCIVRGAGHFKAHVPGPQGPMWWTGATFEPRARVPATDAAAIAAAHAFNLARLRVLLPGVAGRVAGRFARGEVQAWSGLRCATADRLPAVGPLQQGPRPTLWTSTGLGARGLSYALLCAELLAAEIGGEPLPVEAGLARSLRAARPRLLARPVAAGAP